MMRLIVVLREEQGKLVQEVQMWRQSRSNTNQDAAQFIEIAKELGITLEPMHPDAKSSNLLRYFMAQVKDLVQARKVIEQLAKCPEIEAVYVKPEDEMP